MTAVPAVPFVNNVVEEAPKLADRTCAVDKFIPEPVFSALLPPADTRAFVVEAEPFMYI